MLIISLHRYKMPYKFTSQTLLDNIQQREPVYEQLMKTSEQFVETTEPGDEREELKSKIDYLRKRWESLKKKTTDYQASIDEVGV